MVYSRHNAHDSEHLQKTPDVSSDVFLIKTRKLISYPDRSFSSIVSAMYSFVLLNLMIAYTVSAKSVLLGYFVSDATLYLGLFVMVVVAALAWFNKVSSHVWYDLFSSATLLVWLPYWYPDFRDGSPVFFYLPLYFALIAALFSLLFIKRKEQIDSQSLEYFRWLSNSGRFNPGIIMVFMSLSLYFKSHFLLYPVAVTLFILRYALAASLRE